MSTSAELESARIAKGTEVVITLRIRQRIADGPNCFPYCKGSSD